MKRLVIGFGWLVAACVAVAGTGTSNEFRVDTREGERLSAGTEELTFSNLWDGDKDATVTIRQNGAVVFEGLTGEGLKTWTVDRNGRYELTHTTYTNGVKGKVENAVFVVEGKEVPVGELTVEWETGSYKYDSNGKTPGVTAKDGDTLLVKGVDYTVRYEGNTNAGTAKAILTGLPPYVGSVTNEFAIAKRLVELTSGMASKAYDGTSLVCHSVATNGDGFVSGEGVDFTFTGSQTIVGSSKNTFDYTFKTGTLAGNYTITKTEGDLEVTRGEIVNPFDPDDPSSPVSPEVLAKVNCITNYDGEGHSIEVVASLSPLIAANNPKITYSLLRDGTYEAQNPVFTNVVSTSVWYRIEAANFNMFTTNALLKISPRTIANATVAAIADQTYTGTGIEPIPEVTDMRTLIGMSEPTNILTFADYDLSYLNNTNVGAAKVVLTGKNNYDGSLTNVFQIVPAIIPPGPMGAIMVTGYTNAYDAAAHGVLVTASGLKTTPTIQYNSSPSGEWQDDSPTYTDVCDTQVWWRVSAPNYQSVESTIGLKITQAQNAWTTEPAIEGWTYGETAKTPVGAAKFGEVTFVYSPAAVGAAGDYTMIATVAGTANFTGLTTNLTFTIAKATLPQGDDPDPIDPSVDPEDPEQREDPDVRFSTFDYVGVYDGDEHTIDTNALKAAYETVFGGSVMIGYMDDASGAAGVRALPPIVRDAGVTSFWYKVSSANYNDVIHPCKIAITNRLVTLMSGTKTDFVYDGNPHAYTNLSVTAGSFVAGEGIATSNWATVTAVAEGQVPNAFDYEPLNGTLLSNYDLTIVTGKIEVVQAENAWTVEPAIEGWTYGETAKTPVGAAKFGEVSFTYDPMPVCAAGDYTLTATVAGTANYTGLTTNLNFTIAKATLPQSDDPDPIDPSVDPEDPEQREDPDVRFSAFDYVGVYDGEEHTVDTNAMKAAYETAFGETITIGFMDDASGAAGVRALPPIVKDAVVTSFWYKVSSANYNDVIHPCKIAITNRLVTLMSGTKTDFVYDGQPHAYTNLSVTAGSFVAGEGIATSNWATVTEVAEGEVDNAFDYEPLVGTKLSNYALTVVTGRIAVVSPDAVVVTVTGHVASVVYDGLKKSVSGYDVISISDPLYTAADFTFGGQSATNGTNAGTYPMGLKSADFANTNANFSTVMFNVTDGKLVISQAQNAWTTKPAIEGWTYGETAKTPVGAAKFGEVAFVYSPMPVGAAGDYTMTASVTGTANYTGLATNLTFTIAKATLPQGDDPDPIDPSVDPEDPEQREDPTIQFSAFDHVGVYDGEWHTVDTNAMKVAYETAFGESVTIGFMDDASGAAGVRALPPIVKDAGVTSFWYKVTSANYADIVKPCKVAITNRAVTLMSGTKTDFVYDGQPHAYTNLTVTAGSFVAGEGIAPSNWATVTEVAEGQVPNTFDYEPLEGTLLSNYDFTIITGMIAVVQAENAWTVEPAIDGWTYGETAKTPVGVAKFGEVSFTYDPMPVCAAGDYALTATVAGTANYTGLTTNLNFTIAKATLPQGDDPDPIDPSVDPEDPEQREDPDVRFSAFDYVGVYDGEEHTVDTNAMKAAYETAFGETITIGFMDDASGAAGVRALPPIVKDVVVTSFWYKVSSANYADIVKPCKVTITPRDLANVTVEAIGDQTHTGMSIEPTVTVTDGDPSIVTADDYDIVYSDNVEIGEATVTLTGKNNYSGTKVAHFQIVGDSAAVISAQIAWTLLKASGTYLGQLKVTCTSGLAAGIEKLAFLFADRTSDGEIVAALWDTPHRAAKATIVTCGGETYRSVTLDSSLITAENVPVTFGVKNLAATTIPVSERTIELYVRKRVDPTNGNATIAGVDDFVGYVGWVSGGVTNYLPVVAGAQAVSLARASLVSAAPMRLSAVNAALAVGTVVDAESSPYCKLVEFAVDGDEIVGRVEVGAVTDAGTESIGAIGDNATVSLLGTKTLKDGFAHLATVKTDDKGRFRIGKPEDCRFFKLKLTIGEAVE